MIFDSAEAHVQCEAKFGRKSEISTDEFIWRFQYSFAIASFDNVTLLTAALLTVCFSDSGGKIGPASLLARSRHGCGISITVEIIEKQGCAQ